MKLEFSLWNFEKKIQIPNFMKIHPMGAELFYVDDGRTDMAKLTVACRSFAKASKNRSTGVAVDERVQRPSTSNDENTHDSE
jgi:hypothetical protein